MNTIQKCLTTLVLPIMFATGTAMISINANAQDQPSDAFDVQHYDSRMQALLKQLQNAHEITKDPTKTTGQHAAAKAEALKTAKQMLLLIDNRLHKLNIKQGAQLTPTEIVVNTHIMVVVLDLLVGEATPHKDEWNYIY